MSKRFVSLLLALAMVLLALPALGEAETVEITVGSTNQMSGHFFTDMWGNNTADIDVRALLHGYSTVAISRNGTYEIDQTVVREATLTTDPATGDKTYVLELNPGLVYNDGTPITAADYVFSALLQAAPEIYELGGIPSGMSQFNTRSSVRPAKRTSLPAFASWTIRTSPSPFPANTCPISTKRCSSA